MTGVQWVTFDNKFFRWFKANVDGRGFIYPVVNGNCAFIARQYRRYLNEGVERYGFYLGPLSNPFWKKFPVARHGWLELNCCLIYDPSRWCFLRTENPMLAVCPCDSPDYDQGMNRSRLANEKPIPAFQQKDAIDCENLAILSIMDGKVTYERLFWLANLAPQSKVFANEAERIAAFNWLIVNGHAALIPIDNRP